MTFERELFGNTLPRGRARRAAFSALCAALTGALAAACGSPETSTSTSTAGSVGSAGDAGTGGTGGGGGSGGSAGTGQAPLTVDTDKGPVEGTVLGSTRAFLGIPYAAPPTGDLRWKPPAPHDKWSGPLKAAQKGPACAQLGALSGSFDTTSKEDCLTINVWTPDKPASKSLPVLLWIHGGAFVLGSGGEAAYDGQKLSEKTGMIVATFNYRMGPTGFLAMDELKAEDPAHPSTGDYGIEDQRAALAWVKANIAAFGGDPGKVTLFGESAGGISTCMHMASPKSKGLFQRAIIESGPCNIGTEMAVATAQGKTFADKLGCTGAPDVLACLRAKPIEDVMTALPLSNDLIAGSGANWYPVIDGYNLPDMPSKLLESGAFEKVPVILGSNENEGTLFSFLAGAGGKVPDEAAFQTFAEKLVPGHGADIVAEYPIATYGTAQAAADAAIGDAAFVCPTRRAARALSAGGAPTFLYHFTYAPPGALIPGLGAFHSSEIKFVFGNPGQLIPGELNDEELKLWDAISGYWSRHAESGDPNGDMAFAWPKYDKATDESIVLDLTISKQAGLKKDVCDFWDSVVTMMP